MYNVVFIMNNFKITEVIRAFGIMYSWYYAIGICKIFWCKDGKLLWNWTTRKTGQWPDLKLIRKAFSCPKNALENMFDP
jgi:hypothetical protein